MRIEAHEIGRQPRVLGKELSDSRVLNVSVRPWTVDDDLWALIESLLPSWPQRAPGPQPVDDRLCLQGILYVLYNDISW
ncbi:transposase [Streptomyces albicerus]|uniref:transposase n=1 Tax=Streptomyces albicerus TaxID=2569859 RepID=UPI001CED6394